MDIQDVTTAERFDAFMREVWADTCEAVPGGTLVKVSPLYDEWHDAIKTARRCGAVKLYPAKIDEESAYCYEFPNGSRVNIAAHGGSVRVVNRHREV